MDLIDLEAERAVKGTDARDVSVPGCLKAALAQSEDYGWTKCILVLYEELGDGTFVVDTRIAGCSRLESQGLLFSAIKEEILDGPG